MFARPAPVVGALLVLLSAVAETIDCAVAVITGRASRIGQVYDALADRISEACWLVGLAARYAGGPGRSLRRPARLQSTCGRGRRDR